MKAYQIKITVKNSKPPIWRRCIVPAGITFSQLSVILDRVMGWQGGSSFDFEFYYKKLLLIENEYKNPDSAAAKKNEIKDAAETQVDEYMESEKWFTYTYDLEAVHQHRVDIEEVVSDYTQDYAQVLKFKGDCPAEGSSTIKSYDIDEANEKLKKQSEAAVEEKVEEALSQTAAMVEEAVKKPARPQYSNRHLLNNSNRPGNMTVKKDSKIYPNDPCPCGSGRKYKHCCRNK